MAAKRLRSSGTWEYIVKRKGVLAKPLYLSFDTEEQGDAYCAQLERELDAGIVPEELQPKVTPVSTISEAIREYRAHVAVAQSNKPLLDTLDGAIGEVALSTADFAWVQGWVSAMKREQALSPSTIRHYVGALGRCFDWTVNSGAMTINPIRLLAHRYATYSDEDERIASLAGLEAKDDQTRDRRLERNEEPRIRAILSGEKPRGRQRALELPYQAALECLFDLAIETAMRMREMFTLSENQVHVSDRTIYLEKTKNGSKRQVPLSTVAVAAIERYYAHVRAGDRGMDGFEIGPDGLIFPWWSGRPEELRRVTSALSKQFARIFDAAGCGDLRFHDLRHEGTSRLYERTDLSDNEIMKIVGNSGAAHRRYVNLRASDLAKRLW